jgi:hypothetical protein
MLEKENISVSIETSKRARPSSGKLVSRVQEKQEESP